MCDSSLDVTVNKNSFISQTNIRIMSVYTIDAFGCPGQKSKELRLPMPSPDSVRADSVAVGKLGGNIRRYLVSGEPDSCPVGQMWPLGGSYFAARRVTIISL